MLSQMLVTVTQQCSVLIIVTITPQCSVLIIVTITPQCSVLLVVTVTLRCSVLVMVTVTLKCLVLLVVTHPEVFSAPYGHSLCSVQYSLWSLSLRTFPLLCSGNESPRSSYSLTSKRCSSQSLLPFQHSAVPKILQ